MAEVTASMRTVDLRDADNVPVGGRHVWKLQQMLNEWIGSAFAGESPLTSDGIANWETRKVLVGFQTFFGLAEDAIVGPKTWRALIEYDGGGPT